MSTVYLKPRDYYENFYDQLTVELGHRRLHMVAEIHGKELADDIKNNPQRADFWNNQLIRMMVGWPLGERWEKKNSTIQTWMKRDEAKDRKLESTQLTREPTCRHCGRIGLRILSKDLMYRSGSDSGESDDILFMLECTHCQKRTACWEDGVIWERSATLCPKCNTAMDGDNKKQGDAITTTYTCSSCGYSFEETLELGASQEEELPDPEYAQYREIFCFDDKRGQEYLQDKARWARFEGVVNQQKERDANKELYAAVEKIKKLKIAQLIELVRPTIEKAQYIEVRFAEPEMRGEVVMSFSCLDAKADRDEYISRRDLKKVVEDALKGTNWRLMSNGILYRLGYLSGRVRAYEKEDELIMLARRKLKGK